MYLLKPYPFPSHVMFSWIMLQKTRTRAICTWNSRLWHQKPTLLVFSCSKITSKLIVSSFSWYHFQWMTTETCSFLSPWVYMTVIWHVLTEHQMAPVRSSISLLLLQPKIDSWLCIHGKSSGLVPFDAHVTGPANQCPGGVALCPNQPSSPQHPGCHSLSKDIHNESTY